jgi:hypothetical protein
MKKQCMSVIPIRQGLLLSDRDREVADVAYDLWLGGAFRGGSPQEALLIAMRKVRGKFPTDLFVMPKRAPVLSIRSEPGASQCDRIFGKGPQ